MSKTVTLYRKSFRTYYRYRKEIRKYRDLGYLVRNVSGGVVCFQFMYDYDMWRKQK